MKTLERMKVRKAEAIRLLTEEFLAHPTDATQKKLENTLDHYHTIERGIVDWNERNARLFYNNTIKDKTSYTKA